VPSVIPILDVKNQLDREALWATHDNRCCYCGEPVKFTDLEIDHIIPCHLSGNRADFVACLHLLNLPDGYNLNSADNLLPVHRRCNNIKRGAVRDESFLRHFRATAADKLSKFESIRKRLSKQRQSERDLAAVLDHVDKGAIKIEELYNLATRALPFDPKDEIQSDSFVRIVCSRVKIECRLPTTEQPDGLALITFHPVELRGLQLELDHNVITRELFRGLGGPVNSKVRPFICKPSDSKTILQVRFGSATASLGVEEVSQFCQLVDRLAPLYVQSFRRVEAAFNALNARLLSPGIYEIAELPAEVWKVIFDFVRSHDLADGTSEWHIFDAQGGATMKIVERLSEEKWQYLCFLNAIARPTSADMRLKNEIEISIRWESRSNCLRRIQREDEWRWSVEQARRFLYDSLIPKFPAGMKWLNEWRRLAIMENGDLRLGWASGYHPLSAHDFRSAEKTAEAIEQLQLLYLLEHNQFVPVEVVCHTYKYLHLLLQHNKLPPWSVEYIGLKLGCHGRCEPLEFVSHRLGVLEDKKSADNGIATVGSEVDDAFRSILEVLRNGELDPKMDAEWSQWIQILEPAWEDYNERIYCARMRGENFDDEV